VLTNKRQITKYLIAPEGDQLSEEVPEDQYLDFALSATVLTDNDDDKKEEKEKQDKELL
jgi:hypothetical protein